MTATATWRRFLAEFVGTALLVTAVVGSGIMASTLSPYDVGLQLLQNSIATGLYPDAGRAADDVVVAHPIPEPVHPTRERRSRR